MGKHLKNYAMKLGGGLINSDNFSKILEYSRGDASRFLKNALEVKLGHHKFTKLGALSDLKTYFADTDFLKKQVVIPEINSVITEINRWLHPPTSSQGEDGSTSEVTSLLPEVKKKLEDALQKIQSGKDDLNSVADGHDFNSENIQMAKQKIADGIKAALDAKPTFTPSTSTTDGEEYEPVNITAVDQKIRKDLNYMRKISTDQYEERYSIEIRFMKSNTVFKYTKTWEELCEWTQKTLESYGINGKIDPKKCPTPDALKAVVDIQLRKHEIEYKSIEVEEITEFDETQYDPD